MYLKKVFPKVLGALVLILSLSLMSESFELSGSLGVIFFVLGYDILLGE